MAVAIFACRISALIFVLGSVSLCAKEEPFSSPPAPPVPVISLPPNAAERADSEPAFDASASNDRGTKPSSASPQLNLPPAPAVEQSSQRFQWKPALAQYGLEISIQHAWRFVHENGTVDAVAYGPWYHDWIDSISETRGWDDGDGWHASYVGHPLNGGIYGFIEQNNDPLYRKVE